MRRVLCTLCAAGCAALLLTPLVVSARGSEGAVAVQPAPPAAPAVIQLTDDGQTAGAGSLGVEVTDLTDQLRLHFGVPEGRGVLIAEVDPGSAAERAGILPGDVLVSLGGEPVSEAWSLRRAVSRRDAGEQVPLVVVRDRALVELEATLDGRPSRWAARQRSDDDFEVDHDGDAGRDWDADWSGRLEGLSGLGERISQAFANVDWEQFGERWERSGEDWEGRMEANAERWEAFGERMEERFERFGEDLERRMEEHGERWERSGEDWERFGEEMERFGEEWSRFGEELGRSFEEVDWEQMSTEIADAVRQAMASVDWDRLGESIQDAVGHLELHVDPHP